MQASRSPTIIGVDFTSAPCAAKPITVAIGRLDARGRPAVYRLDEILEFTTLDAFEGFLRGGDGSRDGSRDSSRDGWIGGFDLPFGQPRSLIEHEGWPTDWKAFVRFYCASPREALREVFRRWCDGRPAGDKFAWRAADKPAGSSPAMRWANPPVAWMMHAGIGRMVDAGLVFPAHHHPSRKAAAYDEAARAPAKVALEAYPGFTARKVTRASYKSDAAAGRTKERAAARRKILRALAKGRAGLDVAVELSRPWSKRILDDASGDRLDAVISAMQAAHASMLPRYGLPDDLDPLEGWIASVPAFAHPIVEPLVGWFDRAKRNLPWRTSRDPYRVWVSEIMLQQTQVDRVKEFFKRFMARFPDVRSLAAAEESDVLAHWEGLGYYRRARQLHQAARKIVAEHAGGFPRSIEGLVRLPGIGRYTAGAIASIAFDLPAPIVEANSRRVLARLFGHAGRLGGSSGDGPIWKIAESVVPRTGAGRFNQSLMDLGATVCTPARPRCDECPLASHCEAKKTGRVLSIPALPARREPVRRHEAAVVVRRGAKVLLVRREEGEWWAGLWDFPRVAVRSKKAARALGEHLGTIRHSVTHHRITLEAVVSRARGEAGLPKHERRRWARIDELDGIAMPSPARSIARMLVVGRVKPSGSAERRRDRVATPAPRSPLRAS